jgi:hypothetical protein
MERARMFLTRVHFSIDCMHPFDATRTAQIPGMSGFDVASLQDCRELDGSWNMTDWACRVAGTYMSNAYGELGCHLISYRVPADRIR